MSLGYRDTNVRKVIWSSVACLKIIVSCHDMTILCLETIVSWLDTIVFIGCKYLLRYWIGKSSCTLLCIHILIEKSNGRLGVILVLSFSWVLFNFVTFQTYCVLAFCFQSVCAAFRTAPLCLARICVPSMYLCWWWTPSTRHRDNAVQVPMCLQANRYVSTDGCVA